MSNEEKKDALGSDFHLNKWFLDFIGENGVAMIFYAAKLTWRGLSASYTSWLIYNAVSGVNLKSRFRKVQFPQLKEKVVIWSDLIFGVSGIWESLAETIQSRIFDSEKGYLDWKCFQPASKVQLKINDKVLEGRGYVEQLILTLPPWKIPMDELRWGRFVSEENIMVWIELREKEKQQWLWLNGEKTDSCTIEDDFISIPGKNIILNMDCAVLLESEKKIYSVVERLIRYIPGFNKVMPLNFIMADEYKWLSNGKLYKNDKLISKGMAIHELVNFKAE